MGVGDGGGITVGVCSGVRGGCRRMEEAGGCGMGVTSVQASVQWWPSVYRGDPAHSHPQQEPGDILSGIRHQMMMMAK